jgi:hypothetical protein
MPEPLRILAGDCTVTCEDEDETRQERGDTVSIVKPHNCGELPVGRSPGIPSSVREYPNGYTGGVRTTS